MGSDGAHVNSSARPHTCKNFLTSRKVSPSLCASGSHLISSLETVLCCPSKWWSMVRMIWKLEKRHGLINYKDTKAKYRHPKIFFTCKGTLQQVFICHEASYPAPPPGPPLHTVYVYTLVYLFIQGGGRGKSWTREKGRGPTQESTNQIFISWHTDTDTVLLKEVRNEELRGSGLIQRLR